MMVKPTLPANWQGDRCGHNYPVLKCPYHGCLARELYDALVDISEMLWSRPDITAKLHPLMGPAENAVFDACSAATAKVRGEVE